MSITINDDKSYFAAYLTGQWNLVRIYSNGQSRDNVKIRVDDFFKSNMRNPNGSSTPSASGEPFCFARFLEYG